jgi:predicted nucleic acid-binding protein
MSTGDPRRRIVKVFKVQFLENSQKLYCVQQGDWPEIDEAIKRDIKEDDKYLVQAYLAGKAEVLVTTDNPLMEVLHQHNIDCWDRTKFLSDYLREQEHK